MSTTYIDGTQVKTPLLLGNATPLAFQVRNPVMGSDADYTLLSSEYDGSIVQVTSGVTLTATRNVILPLTSGAFYWVYNNTTGAQSLTFKASTGTGITVANGKRAILACDGTNYVRVTADQ